MASLFSTRQAEKRRCVPNGGLGGLVRPQTGTIPSDAIDVAAEPLLKKPQPRRRPPPIRTSCGVASDPKVVSQDHHGNSSIGCGGLWTPNTPTDRLRSSLLVESKLNPGSAPLISQYDPGAPRAQCYSPPETPISPLNSLPVELPGSLLLASQGFPQTTPISPPPSLRVVRRDTDDSILSSISTLSTSLSSDADLMETIRSLTTPLRKHDRTIDIAMPPYMIGSHSAEDPGISQPFSAMSLEDLLEHVPEGNPAALTQLWLPAIRAQFQRMIGLLNEVSELKIESSLEQIAFHKDLKSFSDEIRIIAATYHKVLASAESLVERDTKACHERLKELEDQVQEALDKMGSKDEEIAEYDKMNAELRHTMHDVVTILGSFIHDHVSSWVETINEPRTEEVLEIISDYSRYPEDNARSVTYVRVPDSVIAQYATDIREAKALAKEYLEVLQQQSAMIYEHSRNLDVYANKYEIALKVLKERNHEILLLVQKNQSLTERLEECEAGRVRNQELIAEAEVKAGRYDELRGNMESLKIAHTLDIAQRDEEIATLRQMLGSAREEVFARRADVKNIISQTQTGLSASDVASATVRGGPASKALRFFGMEKDRERGRKLPSSQSMVGFASSHHDAATHPFDTRYSSKEVAPARSKSFLRDLSPRGRRRQAHTTPNTPADSSESRSGSAASLPPVLRARSDSLGATQRHGVLASPINTQKALPAPPERAQQHQLASAARLAEITQAVDGPASAQIASDYFTNSVLGQTAARRVLSNIPEVSVCSPSHAGDTEDKISDHERGSPGSVASSDREVYRRSVCALDMLNSSTLPYSETVTDVERILRGGGLAESGHEGGYLDDHDYSHEPVEEIETGVAHVLQLRPGNGDLRARRERERDGGREERYSRSFVSDSSGSRSEEAEPMTVTQLYHQGRRHIRG